ncbi:MAG TPA: metallophosphoesterase family protein [Polyangia bacterium]|jgi:serine/threonine protein phosphatase 1
MAGRTFAIGDIHGQHDHLRLLLGRLPALTAEDTLVFVGDYLDRGPASREVIATLCALPGRVPARVVTLRGNHEDGWVRVLERGWPEFIYPPGNGCYATLTSFLGRDPGGTLAPGDLDAMARGSFFPPEVADWLRALPCWYEDEHALYIHATLPRIDGRFVPPREVMDPQPLLWGRSPEFFREYAGPRVVCGHTPTTSLPAELSTHTPADPRDLWVHGSVLAVDTGCGTERGFLTAVELPAMRVYESR